MFRRVLPFRYTGRDPSTCVDASAISALVVANVVCAATSGCMMFIFNQCVITLLVPLSLGLLKCSHLNLLVKI